MKYDFTGSDDYAKDCFKGRRMARHFLRDAHPIKLPHLVETMPRPLSGVAIGFLTVIAQAAQ